jgi:hypothetical protein
MNDELTTLRTNLVTWAVAVEHPFFVTAANDSKGKPGTWN